jgi:hypothetical protein
MTAIEAVEEQVLERRITIFTAIDDAVYRWTEEHHTLRLFRPHDVESLLRRAGFEVEVLSDYRSPAVPLDLPGWYVIEARKPASSRR